MTKSAPAELKLREQVVLKLRELILGGELPAGQRVAEIPISERLGVSRTPVRQALTVLAQEGLLSAAGKRGYVVHAFSAKDIVDAIEVRGILEGAAARLAAEAGPSKELIQALETCIADGAVIALQDHFGMDDDVRWVEVNRRFHKLIVEASANMALISALAMNDKLPFASAEAVLGGGTPSRQIARKHHEVLIRAHAEHQRIIEALRLRQGARVESLMQEHARIAQANVTLFRSI